jgi:hypothetical protein
LAVPKSITIVLATRNLVPPSKLYRRFCSMLARERGVMITPEEMRVFALECLRWSDETGDPSNRDLMIRIAKHWMLTASAIEHRQSVLP